MKIVDFLARNMDEKFTINKVAKAVGEHYSLVHRTINKLVNEKVVIRTKVGKSYLCSLNLENEKSLTLIQLSEIEKRNEFYEKNKKLKLILEDFVNSVKSQSKNIISIVLFGSHAKGTATKESDIDILLISKGKIEIEKITREMYAKYGKEISTLIITQSDFEKQKNKAVIKEIIRSHYVLYGVENFVNLVFKK